LSLTSRISAEAEIFPSVLAATPVGGPIGVQLTTNSAKRTGKVIEGYLRTPLQYRLAGICEAKPSGGGSRLIKKADPP
jgi:hypothetical protein